MAEVTPGRGVRRHRGASDGDGPRRRVARAGAPDRATQQHCPAGSHRRLRRRPQGPRARLPRRLARAANVGGPCWGGPRRVRTPEWQGSRPRPSGHPPRRAGGAGDGRHRPALRRPAPAAHGRRGRSGRRRRARDDGCEAARPWPLGPQRRAPRGRRATPRADACCARPALPSPPRAAAWPRLHRGRWCRWCRGPVRARSRWPGRRGGRPRPQTSRAPSETPARARPASVLRSTSRRPASSATSAGVKRPTSRSSSASGRLVPSVSPRAS